MVRIILPLPFSDTVDGRLIAHRADTFNKLGWYSRWSGLNAIEGVLTAPALNGGGNTAMLRKLELFTYACRWAGGRWWA